MKQKFIHLSTYYIDDLSVLVKGALEDWNELGYTLVDIKFANLEDRNGDSHAFLLFNQNEGGDGP